MRNQRGFTMIELIVVIVILGILAATALPRFISVDSGARLAKVNGARGSFQSASALAHATWLVGGSSGTSATMDGSPVTLFNGYPTADAAGISTAAQLSGDYYPTGGGAGAGAVLKVESDNTHAGCGFTYTAATAATGSAPQISAVLTPGAC